MAFYIPRMEEWRDREQDKIDAGQAKIAAIAQNINKVVECRDFMMGHLFRGSEAFIEDCTADRIPEFSAPELFGALLNRNKKCSERLKELVRSFTVARAAYNEANRESRRQQSQGAPPTAEALANLEQLRMDFESKRTDLERQRAAEEARTVSFLMGRALSLLVSNGLMPPQELSSSQVSSAAIFVTRPTHDQGLQFDVPLTQYEQDRDWHLAEIELARDELAAWTRSVENSIDDYKVQQILIPEFRGKTSLPISRGLKACHLRNLGSEEILDFAKLVRDTSSTGQRLKQME